MVNLPQVKMYVIKRGGRKEEVYLDKITSRIQKLCYGLNMDFVDPLSITLKVINGLYPGVTTLELDNLAAEIAASMTTHHPDYATLAARMAVSNLHKETKKQFSEVIDALYNAPPNKISGRKVPLISDEHYATVMKHADRLNSCIIYDRDFSFNYFAFKALERSYLFKIDGKVVERPQHMLMRTAVGIHNDDIDSAINTYNLLSEKYFLHASTTLLAAATPNAQLASSYSLMMPDDSIEGIFTCISQFAYVAKTGGAVGVNVNNIRAKGTYIAGTNGVSNGLIPMLRVFNNTALFVDEEDESPSNITIYLEPWHADIFEALNLKKNTGKEEMRARDMSYALWIPDLFMKRVESNSTWSLMCPHQCQRLSDTWGTEFNTLYEKYEAEGNFIKQVPAQQLWKAIILSQMETGTPHMLYKDTCNRKSNQQNLGTIKGGNYCTDVIQYTSKEEVGVCNLATIAVNMFVKANRLAFDFEKLKEVTKVVAANLDKIIDINHYPLTQAKESSLRHRPIGIGVQGLADTFILMRMAFDSEEAALLNKQIFETIYFGSLEASCELAEKHGSYSSYKGSPVSQGILQYDMWNVTPTNLWNWADLKCKIEKHGVRNSLLVATMPTSTTSQIFGNSESVEPYRSNVYTRRISSGEFQVVNDYLLTDLTAKGMWDNTLKKQIIANGGSIQDIPDIPDDLKRIYKTVWEISQKVIFNMAVDRGAFIDHSQALNVHVENLNYGVLSSMHYYAWRNGLKTGMFYLKSKPISKTVSRIATLKSAVEVKKEDTNGSGDKIEEEQLTEENVATLACSLQNPDSCDMCSA